MVAHSMVAHSVAHSMVAAFLAAAVAVAVAFLTAAVAVARTFEENCGGATVSHAYNCDCTFVYLVGQCGQDPACNAPWITPSCLYLN